MRTELLSFYRPYVCSSCLVKAARQRPLQVRLYVSKALPIQSAPLSTKAVSEREKQVNHRIQELGGPQKLPEQFPRYKPINNIPTLSASDYRAQYVQYIKDLNSHEFIKDETVTVYGRLVRKRRFGAALNFLVLGDVQDNVQCTVNLQILKEENNEAVRKRMSEFWRNVQRGDWIAITGHVQKTQDGDIGLLATEWPQAVSPTLRTVPERASSQEFLNRNRHVQQIVKPDSREILRLRHRVITGIRNFLTDKGFVEVSTPLLVQGAGGAVARPFETYATEFSELPLNLRIAPELWLKRLVVGNMDKVFEIGPAFRNEGVDFTHNPEFTICEFYQAFASLPQLISMTENLFNLLSSVAMPEKLGGRDNVMFTPPFKQLPFIPTLSTRIQEIIPHWSFPDLKSITARESLLEAFDACGLTRPDQADEHIPRLLDSLSSHVLEPLCIEPTFITHHPECMSPLSKSFDMEYPSGNHPVAARAELFIHGREYVNCYEEENSPTEQRRKFEDQLSHRHQGSDMSEHIDENYIETLEWGMPPTGGWGCGVDRIVMLFGGKRRIADVLSFGNLTNVVRLGSGASTEHMIGRDDTVQDMSSDDSV